MSCICISSLRWTCSNAVTELHYGADLHEAAILSGWCSGLQALGLEQHEYWMQVDLWLQVSASRSSLSRLHRIATGLMLEEPFILT